ncbi:MAG TPA: ferredoxin [Candidatus Nanoarchaeia archaeon]|nr:ferredoxin [Candidatus Nanoarchaeia archaeon]
MTFTIILDREKCIGSASCQALAPKFWKLDNDGKINLLNSTKKHDMQERTIEKKDFALAMESAQACPVNAIHIMKDNEKLI